MGNYVKFKRGVMELYRRVVNTRPTLHDEVEQEANEDYLHDQPGQDFTPQEHKNAPHRTFRSFRISGIGGADVDGYIGMVRPNVKTLVEGQVESMGSAKIQLSLWIHWRKPIEGTKEYEEANKAFHSNMASVFQGSNVDDMLDMMFAQVKTHVENLTFPKSVFTIGRILHLDVDFHKLKLTRGSSRIYKHLNG
ncbi:uncharacterized protein LOC130612195 [Hydractinia symbiolongicarpus]|uniref:uncharacterized protein LOC130612195 n=1 Tax=Hydractinia symbiolongicarpus TaxID=13093 RepID=UPI00254FC02A|nr:uncharacterized protein LOC130612195 [Hydractinia symbiolongicarpus]